MYRRLHHKGAESTLQRKKKTRKVETTERAIVGASLELLKQKRSVRVRVCACVRARACVSLTPPARRQREEGRDCGRRQEGCHHVSAARVRLDADLTARPRVARLAKEKKAARAAKSGGAKKDGKAAAKPAAAAGKKADKPKDAKKK